MQARRQYIFADTAAYKKIYKNLKAETEQCQGRSKKFILLKGTGMEEGGRALIFSI